MAKTSPCVLRKSCAAAEGLQHVSVSHEIVADPVAVSWPSISRDRFTPIILSHPGTNSGGGQNG